MPTQLPCQLCNGEGKVASTPQQQPWSYWQKPGETGGLSVRMGIVKPVTCPTCNGVGFILL